VADLADMLRIREILADGLGRQKFTKIAYSERPFAIGDGSAREKSERASGEHPSRSRERRML
jgi:hypothetical protein